MVLLMRGSVPGCAKETALTWWFGSAPKPAESDENDLLCVLSCACTSRPTTNSYFSVISAGRTDICYNSHRVMGKYRILCGCANAWTCKCADVKTLRHYLCRHCHEPGWPNARLPRRNLTPCI